jgi:hypothetical protein
MIVFKEADCDSLAPIASPVRYRSGEAEILLCRGSAQKIIAKSGKP